MKIITQSIHDEDNLVLKLPTEPYRTKLLSILEKCDSKCNGYVSVDITRPYKARTTGEYSQNNLFWKLCTIIANEVGDDSEGMQDTENGIKMRALSKGYPFHLNKMTGEKVPESMRMINTVECSYLIDTAYQIISELGINLEPEYVKETPVQSETKKEFNQLEIF